MAKLLGISGEARADATSGAERENLVNPDGQDLAALNKLIPGIEANGFPSCFVGRDERYLFANKAYCAFLAKSPEAVIGRAIRDVLQPEESALIAPYFDRALRKGEIVHFHRLSLDATGHKRWVLVNYFPQRHADGSIYGFLAIVTNAERVKALEAETLESERLLRALTNSAGLPIMRIDSDFTIRFGNQPLLDWIDRSAPQILGKRFTDLFPLSIVNFYIPLVQRALAGESFKVETLSHARSGAQRPPRARATGPSSA